jgi:hypothetical protein
MRLNALPLLVAALGLSASAVGCGSSGQEQLSLGSDDGGPSFGTGSGDAAGAAALDAYIEQDHVAVKFITLSCSGDCATVQAVGTGGYAPYTFRWDDGTTSATRLVCPTSSTSYSVQVTDTGTSGELARAAASVRGSLAASVIACPDGGPSDAGSGLKELLWSSPLTTGSWQTFCVSFTPTEETASLGLRAAVAADAGSVNAQLFVDHLVPVSTCP